MNASTAANTSPFSIPDLSAIFDTISAFVIFNRVFKIKTANIEHNIFNPKGNWLKFRRINVK
ncbi:hypothetical protein KH5_08510 [Urechidicola sp. KH5]